MLQAWIGLEPVFVAITKGITLPMSPQTSHGVFKTLYIRQFGHSEMGLLQAAHCFRSSLKLTIAVQKKKKNSGRSLERIDSEGKIILF